MVVVMVMMMVVEPVEEKQLVMMMALSMEIFHVMVVVVVFQDYIKVAGVYPCLAYTADARFKTCEGKTFQGLVEYFGIGSQVKKGSHGHIAADA